MRSSLLILFIGASFILPGKLFAQDFTAVDYNKALWMATRFYGGQRSGDANHPERKNWIVYDHLPSGVSSALKGVSYADDADGSYDLSGGWFDCGDHVKFGQTQFYSGYVLLKAYSEFKSGFDDVYSADYAGYAAGDDWTWEGAKGKKNGIPDVLDELMHATDYFIKCAKDDNTFYYEIGDGTKDHQTWITSVKMQTNSQASGGSVRDANKNPNDGAMPSFCAATLALMSKVMENYNPEYSALCLKHAKYAYNYAAKHIGEAAGSATGGFYGENGNSKNAWAIALAEMYRATNDAAYLTEVNKLTIGEWLDVSPNYGYTFDYSNNGELALYLMIQIGKSSALSLFNNRIEDDFIKSTNYKSEGVYFQSYATFGPMRYAANAAFLIALYSKINNKSLDQSVYSNIDYIMGSNTAKISFIAGFTANNTYTMPKYPHHRNVYLRDDNPSNSTLLTIPTRNMQFGALYGGSDVSTEFVDDRQAISTNEVCIDYNAGLVAALAAIRAELDPVDTSKLLGSCPSPDLKNERYLCHEGGSVTLSSGLVNDGVTTFEWFKDGVSQAGPASTLSNYVATQPGTWKVVADSGLTCSVGSEAIVYTDIPSFDFGADIDLCAVPTTTLNLGVNNPDLIISWKKNGTLLPENEPTYTVRSAGTYSASVEISGCTAQLDQITVTSVLPEVENQYFCDTGSVTFNIVDKGGIYKWYSSESGGISIASGISYTTSLLTANTTYYVMDDLLNTIDTIGMKQATHTMTGGTLFGDDWFRELEFDALSDFSITGFTLDYYVSTCSSGSAGKATVTITDSLGKVMGTSKANISCTSNKYQIGYTSLEEPVFVAKGSGYLLTTTEYSAAIPRVFTNTSKSPYPYETTGYIKVTGPGYTATYPKHHVGIFDFTVSAGSYCKRMPVSALDSCVDKTTVIESFFKENEIDIFPNPSSDIIHVNLKEGTLLGLTVFNLTGQALIHEVNSSIDLSELATGIYVLQIKSSEGILFKKIIKN